jgi:hypothetical protein
MKILLDRAISDRELNMTVDGRFIDPPRTPVSLQVFRVAILVACIAAGLAIAAVAIWFALMLVPVALVAAAVAWGAWRWQLWRAGR